MLRLIAIVVLFLLFKKQKHQKQRKEQSEAFEVTGSQFSQPRQVHDKEVDSGDVEYIKPDLPPEKIEEVKSRNKALDNEYED